MIKTTAHTGGDSPPDTTTKGLPNEESIFMQFGRKIGVLVTVPLFVAVW